MYDNSRLSKEELEQIAVIQREQLERLAARCRDLDTRIGDLKMFVGICAGATITAAVLLIIGVIM